MRETNSGKRAKESNNNNLALTLINRVEDRRFGPGSLQSSLFSSYRLSFCEEKIYRFIFDDKRR